MAEAMIAAVAVSGVPFSVDRSFSYLVPEELGDSVRAGMRVMVPFSRANKPTEAMVLSVSSGERTEKLKYLLCVLDDAPLLDEGGLRLARWMKARYFCTLYDAFRTILPAGIWYTFQQSCRLCDADAWESCLAASDNKDERFALSLLRENGGEMERGALIAACPSLTAPRLRELVSLGLLTIQTSARRSVRDKTVRMVHLAMPCDDALAMVEPKRKTAPVRYEAVKLLCADQPLSSADLCYYTGATMATLRALEKSGVIAFSQEEQLRVEKRPVSAKCAAPIVLNDEQSDAYDAILSQINVHKPSVTLLQGVTASGKTQVYIRLIQAVLAMGKTALVLVPEIALTPQMLDKFEIYFGSKVAMLHSALKLTERYDQWKRIRRGEVQVVLGTRSAVFAPLSDLALIIIDEEQETTYQSENPPRYHTHDIAKFRCAQDGAVLLLGSATPSIDSAYQAEAGNYRRVFLRRRYNEKSLPDVCIADMRQEVRRGNDTAISEVLRDALAQNISRSEQSILFLNRRGNSRMLLCVECGMVPQCPRCSAPMTYHSANARLMCHYCGHSEKVYDRCPDCGGILKPIGTGTQKVEQELSDLFPGTAILRMDTDTVGASQGHEKLLQKFEKENTPILLGTQMVAKGLDFRNVTLVGVLSADLSLYVENYHAAERTFSLLAQVVGRAGRGDKNGRAIIQTFTPENDVICAAAAQDYDAFYRSEIRLRRLRRYPPFADIFTLTVTGADESKLLHSIVELRDGLRALIAASDELRAVETDVLGPSAAPVTRVNNQYRYRLFLVGRNDVATRRMISYVIGAFYAQKKNRGLNLFADCNSLQ